MMNPGLPVDALEDAIRKLIRPEGATLETRNRSFHRMLIDGVTVEYRAQDGSIRGDQAMVVDFDNPWNNVWLAVNQFTVTESGHERRPDIVLFVNGLPLWCNRAEEPRRPGRDDDIGVEPASDVQVRAPDSVLHERGDDRLRRDRGPHGHAHRRHRVVQAVAHHLRRDPGRFAHCRSFRCFSEGACDPGRFIALVRDFIVFEDDGGPLVKKMAGYHQFHAVRVALDETLRAARMQQAEEVREQGGRYESGRKPGGEPRRPPNRCGLAHAGVGQEPVDGVLRWRDHPGADDGESDDRRSNRPQRPGRPALQHVLQVPGAAAPAANPG